MLFLLLPLNVLFENLFVLNFLDVTMFYHANLFFDNGHLISNKRARFKKWLMHLCLQRHLD